MKLKKLLKVVAPADTVIIGEVAGERGTLYHGDAKGVPARLFDYKVSLVYSAIDNKNTHLTHKTASSMVITVKRED